MKIHIDFLVQCCIALGVLGSVLPTTLSAAERLNVLFILSDDMRPELGCYGAPVQSPNIDKLAAASTRFDRAYCQYPLCNPSRTSLLTGLFPTQTGVLDNSSDFRKTHPDHITLPQLFKNSGYTTVRLGKVFHGGIDDPASWSEGGDSARPNRANLRQPAPAQDKSHPGPNEDGRPFTQSTGVVTVQMRNSDQRVRLEGDGQMHADYRTADNAIAALGRLKDKPFFITCGFTKPHSAPTAPNRFYDLYPVDRIQLPNSFAAYPTPGAGFPTASLNRQNIDLFWNRQATEDEARLMLQAYRASVSWVDWNVGRVLAELDRLQLRDKTIVVFWGDHGYHLGEKGKWSKHGSLFEVGARVPLLISVPHSQNVAKVVAHPVQSLDIYPTLASLCGLSAPKLPGHDLSQLLDNPGMAWEHPAFTVTGNAKTLHRTVRVKRWRYIQWSGDDGGTALIDEESDPQESKNLVEDPKYADTVKELRQLLENGMTR